MEMKASLQLQQRGGVDSYTTYNPDDGSFEVRGVDRRSWTARLAHCSKARALLAATALAAAAAVYVVTDEVLCQKFVCAGGGGSSPRGAAPPQKLAGAGARPGHTYAFLEWSEPIRRGVCGSAGHAPLAIGIRARGSSVARGTITCRLDGGESSRGL